MLALDADHGLPRALEGDPGAAAHAVLRLLDAAQGVSAMRLAVRRRPRRDGEVRVAFELCAPDLDVRSIAEDLADLGAFIDGECVVVEISGPRAARATHGWEAAQPEPGTQVLVVDDDPVVCRVLRHVLELAGCRVIVVGDGPPALEAVRTEPGLDLVLLDMGLPTLDGTDVARRIRASGSVIPQVAVTANTFAADHADCLRAGMNAALTKPVVAHRLLAEVALWTANHQELPAPVEVGRLASPSAR